MRHQALRGLASGVDPDQASAGKYQEVYLKRYVALVDAHPKLDTYFCFYNHHHPQSPLDDRTPDETYRTPIALPTASNQ